MRSRQRLLTVSIILLVIMPLLCVWLARENGGSVWAAACSGLLFASIVVFCMAGGKGWCVNPPRIPEGGCFCLKPHGGRWADLGHDDVELFYPLKGWKAKKHCPVCEGSGRPDYRPATRASRDSQIAQLDHDDVE